MQRLYGSDRQGFQAGPAEEALFVTGIPGQFTGIGRVNRSSKLRLDIVMFNEFKHDCPGIL